MRFRLPTLNQSSGIHISFESDTIKDNFSTAIDFERFVGMMAVTLKIISFWDDAKPHGRITLLRRFREAYLHHIYDCLLLYP
jgi:hypothetical protein